MQPLFQPQRLRPHRNSHLVPYNRSNCTGTHVTVDKCQPFPPFRPTYGEPLGKSRVSLDCLRPAPFRCVYLAAPHSVPPQPKSGSASIHRPSPGWSRYNNAGTVCTLVHGGALQREGGGAGSLGGTSECRLIVGCFLQFDESRF